VYLHLIQQYSNSLNVLVTVLNTKQKYMKNMDKIVPIIKEEHGDNYSGAPYLTLVSYKHEPLVMIVDNYANKTLSGYVLDYCEAQMININTILKVAEVWWEQKCIEPFSVSLSRAGIADSASLLYRSFQEQHIIRVIGPVPVFELNKIYGTKRRKYRELKGIEIKKAS